MAKNENTKIIILENTFYTVLSLRMEILSHFAKKGYSIYILSTGPTSDMAKLENYGYHCIDVGSVVVNPIRAVLFSYRLLKTIHAIQPQIIFSFTIRPNIFGSIAARILRLPIVSNVTGTGPLIEDRSIMYRLIRLAYKFAFKKNQRIFFQNEDDYHYFLNKKFVHSEQAKLLPGSGVDTEFYKPLPKTNSDFSFLMISRLIKDKGIIEYVEAAKIMKRKYPKIQFNLLGPFWTQSISKNTIREEDIFKWVQDGIINYLGYADDVRPIIAASDVVVLPSYREGCANVLMQAASMGKPLIASDVTGCRNLINHQETGRLCEVKNINSLASSMEKIYLLSEDIRINMGKKGRQKMQNEYPKSKVLEAYEEEVK